MNKILITGAAGFIGFSLIKKLLNSKFEIVGIDNLNDYYDVNLKFARLNEIGISKKLFEQKKQSFNSKYSNFKFVYGDIADKKLLKNLFYNEQFDVVINLAAQAGVRYSLINPYAYVKSNVEGFLNLIELSKSHNIKHFIYASSSSVYGLNESFPFSESSSTEHPISLYAATKKSNEMIAHSYSHLFNLPTTGLRFFTVYGPWGRPDMALYNFTDSIINGKPIRLFNYGKMFRDFTYIDDIVESIFRLIDFPPSGNKSWDPLYPKPDTSVSPYTIFNIGNSNPISLVSYIELIEKNLNIKSNIIFEKMQPGDVAKTISNTDKLKSLINFAPTTKVEDGIKYFINWYKIYNNIS
jgi:UDP-glucuronate 4-epimerase